MTAVGQLARRSKYDGLSDRLWDAPVNTIMLTFDEIGGLVPGGMPVSGYLQA